MKDDALQALGSAATLVTCGFAGRAGYLLFGGSAEQPPADAVQFEQWRRRRRWLLFSELSALPGFVALALLLPDWLAWPAVLGKLFALAIGALGFPFVSGVARALIERRLGVSHGG